MESTKKENEVSWLWRSRWKDLEPVSVMEQVIFCVQMSFSGKFPAFAARNHSISCSSISFGASTCSTIQSALQNGKKPMKRSRLICVLEVCVWCALSCGVHGVAPVGRCGGKRNAPFINSHGSRRHTLVTGSKLIISGGNKWKGQIFQRQRPSARRFDPSSGCVCGS